MPLAIRETAARLMSPLLLSISLSIVPPVTLAPGNSFSDPPLPIRPGATWEYFKGTTTPDPAWNMAGFGAFGWRSGPSGFGFGNGDNATVLSDMRNGYTSLYIRKTFDVPDLAVVGSLKLSMAVDGGFVAYINGIEVARSAGGSPQVLAISKTALVPGANVIAIQASSRAIDSAAFSLAPVLEAVAPQRLPPTITNISPSSGADGIAWSPRLCVGVTGPDGDVGPIAVSLHGRIADDAQPFRSIGTALLVDGQACVSWSWLQPGAKYEWYATAWDGVSTATGSQADFTTSSTCTTNSDCDDNNPCTTDDCDSATGCVHTNNFNACSDGNACTTDDTCSNGTCRPGAPRVCDDSNVCTDNSCDPATGCVFTTNADACSDGNACTTGDVCSAGQCQPGTAVVCDDTNPCTTDSCDRVTGCAQTNNTNACSDGDACTTNDTCSNGTCRPGAPRVCDDHNVCTDDACDPATGCVFTPNTNACSDGNACTTGDVCSSGQCQPGPAVVCDDNNPCTTDDCDQATGCAYTNNFNACSDGNACTTDDTCSNGTCRPGAPLVCDDHNVCTDNSCNPVNGCFFANNANACSDGNACTTGDVCSSGQCQPGPAVVCDDDNLCTDDSCDPATGCVFTNNANACSDGNACTTDDTCSNGACRPGAPRVCDDSNVCTDDSCDPATGCVFTNNANACSDGNACTTGDVCSSGRCQPGNPVVCDDDNRCTSDACDPATGCVFANNTNACSDGNACTTDDRCSNGTCRPGAPRVCDDDNVCTSDTCAPATGCVFTNNTNACSDGNACTRSDRCSGGECVGGNPIVCAGPDQCHGAGVCDPASGACVNHAKPDGTPCSDANVCTTIDTCLDGACTGREPLQCDDGNVCNGFETCDPVAGCRHNGYHGSPGDHPRPCHDDDGEDQPGHGHRPKPRQGGSRR